MIKFEYAGKIRKFDIVDELPEAIKEDLQTLSSNEKYSSIGDGVCYCVDYITTYTGNTNYSLYEVTNVDLESFYVYEDNDIMDFIQKKYIAIEE